MAMIEVIAVFAGFLPIYFMLIKISGQIANFELRILRLEQLCDIAQKVG